MVRKLQNCTLDSIRNSASFQNRELGVFHYSNRSGQFQNYQSAGAIGFFSHLPENSLMLPFLKAILPSQPSLLRAVGIGMTILACSFSVLADTPALLRHVPAAGCYCHCAESNLRAGCVKMCDSKKHAPRPWSRSCAKPHLHTPARNSNAGPRFPHPGRAEHARL